jgi:hypothetical protein
MPRRQASMEVEINPPRQWKTLVPMWPPTVVRCEVNPALVDLGLNVVAQLCDEHLQPITDGVLFGSIISPVKCVDGHYYAAFANLCVTTEWKYKLRLQMQYFEPGQMNMVTLCEVYTRSFNIFDIQGSVTLEDLGKWEARWWWWYCCMAPKSWLIRFRQTIPRYSYSRTCAVPSVTNTGGGFHGSPKAMKCDGVGWCLTHREKEGRFSLRRAKRKVDR